ncbi:hypothetical protein H2203_008943 [Taxawa tesnikishii (nom. ined.)]|nr:hypothetical protein H2203_008943 [Dothideales sp. JES 119]
MASSYAEAIAILKAVGREFSGRNCRTEAIPLVSAVGRIVARNYASPESTPGFDSSAMDGYAIHSAATANASFEKPVTFRVMGTAAAGDPLVTISSNRDENGTEPCVEIMTGSRFPTASEGEQSFDAVVKVEDVFPVTFPATAASARYIQVVKPVHPNANKRFAGSDFQNGDAIIHQTQVIRPHHVMALASVGFTEVEVLSKPKVGLWSTGEELLPTSGDAAIQSHIRDVNGPFLQATLNECGIDVDFLGVIEDSASALRKALEKHLTLGSYDLSKSSSKAGFYGLAM